VTVVVEPRPRSGDAIVSTEVDLMGGRVGIHLRAGGEPAAAELDARRTLAALRTWAGRLTRFDPASELSGLNADPGPEASVGPTLAALLDWGRAAEVETNGIVNVAMLDRRLAAEAVDAANAADGADPAQLGGSLTPAAASDRWSLDRVPRGAVVHRPAGLRFDLDGVVKGWLADRALMRLRHYPAAVVDADGDLAIRLAPGETWDIGVDDPAGVDQTIATLRLATPANAGSDFGVATSGTSIHRWARKGTGAHHLIDPRTGRPAITDVVQATVVAGSARLAEAFAKASVILGSAHALAAFDRPGVDGLVLLTEGREILATPRTLRFLA
jgi:thiamine biosynthesis lipoprotein